MDRQALVEVCAPYIFSQGHCVGYDTLGLQIQQIFKLPCSKLPEPCPVRFVSWNSTAFSGCYDLVEKQQMKSNSGKIHGNLEWTYVVSAIAAFVVGLLVAIFAQKLYGRLKRRLRTGEINENQSGNDPSENLLNDTGRVPENISLTGYDATGFDKESFDKVIKDFHLTSVEELFREHHIDCVVTFIGLDSEKLKNFGLDVGQQEKCKNAIQRIVYAANKRQNAQRGDSQTNMSTSERSESRDHFASAQSMPPYSEKRERPPHKRTLSYPT